MNKTITFQVSIIFIFLCFLAFKNLAQAQTITLDYIPQDPICSFDTLGCTGSVSTPFSLTAENNEGIIVSHQVSLNDEMPVEDVYGSLSGVYPGYIISGNYPIGQHTFVVTVVQGGDTLVTDIEFSVVDCVAPQFDCLNPYMLPFTPQPDGCCGQAIWASNIISQPVESCSEPVTYTVHRTEAVNDGTNVPSIDQIGMVLDCNDPDMLGLTVYAWDSAFNPYQLQPDGSLGGPNYSACEVLVFIYNHCDPTPDPWLAGDITTEEAEGVEGVTVQVTGDLLLETMTAQDGSYEISSIGAEGEYLIKPTLNENVHNGVSTFDVVLIQKHLLAIQPLDSPYKIIAADVNASGEISVFDLILIRKLILGINDDFPNNTSWRFVDASYVFENPSAPLEEDFPEVIEIEESTGDELNLNFVGVKIGDVNGSSTPNN